jgi:hypothetical protein
LSCADLSTEDEKGSVVVESAITGWDILRRVGPGSELVACGHSEDPYMGKIGAEEPQIRLACTLPQSNAKDLAIFGANSRTMASCMHGSTPVRPTVGARFLRGSRMRGRILMYAPGDDSEAGDVPFCVYGSPIHLKSDIISVLGMNGRRFLRTELVVRRTKATPSRKHESAEGIEVVEALSAVAAQVA